MSHPVLPELSGTKTSTREYTWSYPWLQTHRQQRMALLDVKGRRGPWSWKGSMLERFEWGTGGGEMAYETFPGTRKEGNI